MATIRTRTNTDGSTVYHVQIRLKGHPTQTGTFTRLTDARRWVQLTESDIREGRKFPATAAKRHTMAELIQRYRDSVIPHKRPNTARPQLVQLDFWQSQIGHLRLADVTPPIIAEQRDILSKKFEPGTVNRYLAVLSHMFTMAIREWLWAEVNPVARVNKPSEPKLRIRFLSDDERSRLLDACKASTHPYLYTVVVLAVSTGARKMEILNLEWADVDLRRGLITLHDTKNKERRALAMAGHALELMRDHARVRRIDSGLVFPRPDGQAPTHLEECWQIARRKAGITDFRFHDLRHTCASYLAMNGASLAEIAEVLGHKTLGMVKRYAHLSEQHTAGVVARMNERIFGDV